MMIEIAVVAITILAGAAGWLVHDHLRLKEQVYKLMYWAFGIDGANGGHVSRVQEEFDTIEEKFNKVHERIQNNREEHKKEHRKVVQHLEKIHDKIDGNNIPDPPDIEDE